MRIQHEVELEDKEITNLFAPVVACAVASYPDQASMDATIAESKAAFTALLSRYARTIFKLGHGIGKTAAADKDTLLGTESA